jgi:PTH1 family peptidyl-tRNA hydrolase
MNNSGLSIEHLKNKYEISYENILIIQDDIDLPFGSWKIVFDRGAGGHNGIKSIIEYIDTNKFVRIKIGIAPVDTSGNAIKPKPGFLQSQSSAVAKFVLKDFSKNDLEKLNKLVPKIKDTLNVFVRDGHEKAMNEFN